ncbi:MAG: DNA ligase D [Firmicutes bacterium]|nr:DNA ligase D [Bacillota bacterium]
MKLDEYEKKRDFTDTKEPAAEIKESNAGLRFVVQKHYASHLHYDFRLELDGVLKSWAVPKGPTLDPSQKRLAMMVEDHPYDYKDFEGTIQAGNYGAGSVFIWDEGTYHSYDNEGRAETVVSTRQGLAKGDLKFVLKGNKLQGKFALIKMKSKQDNSWLLLKKKDEYAVEDFHITAFDDPFPHKIKPMLATLVSDVFDHKDWIFEIKLDGYRTIAEVEQGKVELYSRNLNSFTQLFDPIAKALTGGVDAVYDGEVVILDELGRSKFQLLQNYAKGGVGELTYFVFDLLYLEGKDLRSLPLQERKAKLKQFLLAQPIIRYVDEIAESGKAFFAVAEENGLEGIIAKRSASRYQEGKRSNEWQKIKVIVKQECIICGFTRPKGSRKYLGSLVLGVYEKGELLHVGNCGTGFTATTLLETYNLLQPLVQTESPFTQRITAKDVITWVSPSIVCDVKFSEWTDEGIMRHPVFLGVKAGKKAENIQKQKSGATTLSEHQPEENEISMKKNEAAEAKPSPTVEPEVTINKQRVKLTNLDKMYWPEEQYTKGEVISYYRSMASHILPYLKDRPQSLYRTPNGISEGGFYQKNVSDFIPEWVHTHAVFSASNEKSILYLLCQNEQTLIYMANLGCIEINPWLSRVQSLDHPDYLVIDLDPEDISFAKVVETALAVYEVLESADIVSFPKTSGATGIHIFIPLQAQYGYDVVREFARLIATLVHNLVPSFTSIERSPKKRQQKVYLDFLQNRPGQTLASVYSIRPRPQATVSTPLRWQEVKLGLDPHAFTMKNIQKRVEKLGDLFKGVLGPGIDIKKSITKLEQRFR